jgi:predicted phage terminase large subunit-like protein
VWHFGRHPDHTFIASSYAESLANRNSYKARALAAAEGSHVFPAVRPAGDRASVVEWNTVSGAVFKAVGVGGGLTGHGGHVIVVDDPVKDREQAESELWRAKVWDWFREVAYTRLAPGGGILIMMTRWHDDDLVGRILAESARGGEVYGSCIYPALAREDEDHRTAGEALHPERFPAEALGRIRAALGDMSYAALYDQDPMPTRGGTIRSEWLDRSYSFHNAPSRSWFRRVFQSWDTAKKDKEQHDPTVCTTFGETPDRDLMVLDVDRARLQYPDLKERAKLLAARWNPSAVLVEDKGSGESLIQDLRRDPSFRWSVIPIEPGGIDKVTRMAVQTSFLEARRLIVPDAAPWLAEWKLELLRFPKSKHDDQVDSLSQALKWFAGGAVSMLQALSRT